MTEVPQPPAAAPLCFVLMPFGRKPGPGGALIDFDAVWNELLRPAIAGAGLEPLRADEEQAGGIIHKPMFERLILCEYAVADLTAANANVFYELGIRHGIKPFCTTLVFAEGMGPLPFDVSLLRGLPYRLGPDGRPSHAQEDRAKLAQRLGETRRQQLTDSPLFQLVEGFPDIQRLKTDVFRERVQYAQQAKARLAQARQRDAAAVHQVEDALLAQAGRLEDVESGVLVDLYLSYRDVKDWKAMAALAQRMPRPLAETTLVREQLGLALNRDGRFDEAEQVLRQLIEDKGPSSETCGILGRVYKDRWQDAVGRGAAAEARGWLKKAIATYLQGFEADWRDAYPGINAATLMELANPPDERRHRLLEVVTYAVERRVAGGQPDYWDHATLLELAVLRQDEDAAQDALSAALACRPLPWMLQTTLNNLRLISQARAARGQAPAWAQDVERDLERAAAPPPPSAPGA